MQLDEQIQQHIVALPVDLKAEVLDFVLFLEQKQARQGVITPNQEQQLFVDRLLEPVLIASKLACSF